MSVGDVDRTRLDPSTADDQGLDLASAPFVGRWNRLVSSTNWEKGRIISEWRAALIAASAPASEYADEAWACRIGNVTGQHIGRLRRVYERFGDSHRDYPALYWSHFQTAIEWDDAEMWLEGAVQDGWSVAQMRRRRLETLGQLDGSQAVNDEIVSAGLDEDADGGSDELRPDQATVRDHVGPRPEGPDFGEEHIARDESHAPTGGKSCADSGAPDDVVGTQELVRPFERLTQLPHDLAEAFDAFKLAILQHKMDGWAAVSSQDVLDSLDALKALVLAPSH